MRLNVRCCCQPVKIYGTLEVPDAFVRSGARIQVPIRRPDGSFDALHLEVAKFAVDYQISPEMKRLMYGTIDTAFHSEFALKYEGDDQTFEEKLEAIKRVRGFQIAEHLLPYARRGLVA